MKVRARSDEATRARLRTWGVDPGVVQLVLVDQDVVPRPEEIGHWLDSVDERGARTVRTGALFPAAAERFAAAGFEVIDTLALLRVDFAVTTPPELAEDPEGIVTAPLRRHHHAAAAAIDQDAFGPPWGNDAADIEEIRAATPTHHGTGRFLRSGRVRRELAGFAITGAASGQGYLQRLAVASRHQGAGHGRALTIESLAWMRRRRLRAGLVNTSVTNEAALGLYSSLGFRPLAEQLVVMQRPVGAR